jgi:Trypsin Inhibitor like cysteine rich domain
MCVSVKFQILVLVLVAIQIMDVTGSYQIFKFKPVPPRPVCTADNEEYQPCGNNCEMKCSDLGTAAAHNNLGMPWRGCVEGCYCKTGYIRNGDGACVVQTTDACGETD